MKKYDRQKRNNFWLKIWEQFKSDYSMEEMAFLLNIPLTTFWDTIKKTKVKKQFKEKYDGRNNKRAN